MPGDHRPKVTDSLHRKHRPVHVRELLAEHVRRLSPNRPRAAIGQHDHQVQNAAQTLETQRFQQPTEQRMSRRRHPHLSRKHRPKMLQSVAVPQGTGKSHLLEALGHHAIDQGLSVAWFSVEDLGTIIRRHRVDDTVSKAFAALAATSLTVIDDIGLLPISADAAEGLYRLVDVAYERRSLALSTNLHPSGFDQLMDKTLASALVDRLMHHAHVLLTDGESLRLADALAGKGVVPLTD